MIPQLPENINDFLNIKYTYAKDFGQQELVFQPIGNLNTLRDIVKSTYFDLIVPYYQERNIEATTGIWNFLAEPLKNANYHGGTKHHNTINFAVYLTPHALVASFNDKGDYFKRTEVKKAYESKILFPEKHKIKHKEIGGGAGTGMIYDLSELIHVDTNTGTLYTGITTSGVLFHKPKTSNTHS